MNSHVPFDAIAGSLEDHPYQQKLKKELKEKKQKELLKAQHVERTEKSSLDTELKAHAFISKETDEELYEDRYDVQSFEATNDMSDTHDSSDQDTSPQSLDPDREIFNPSHLWRLIGYDLSPEKRQDQLKQSYQDTLQQYYSHNDILSQFSAFKASVLTKLLDHSGIDSKECKKLHKEAKEQVVEENKHLMAENIYHMELSQLLYGKKKKTRPYRRKMRIMQERLMRQMDKIDSAYWSKDRLLEEKITQCRKIRDELDNERKNLIYFVDQLWDGQNGHRVNATAEDMTMENDGPASEGAAHV